MSIDSTLDRIHTKVKENRWMQLFTILIVLHWWRDLFLRESCFFLDEHFAKGLSANHPMGHYLEALHLTGYYYYFISTTQILAAILLQQ